MSERVMVPMNSLIQSISMGPFGSDVKVEYMRDEGIPIIDGSNLTGIKMNWDSYRFLDRERGKKLQAATAHKGDIIVTHRGTLGQLVYVPDDCPFDEFLISQSQFRVTLNVERVNPVYFAYYFHTTEGQKRLLSFANYVGVPALASATTNFKELEFPLIDLQQQNIIAELLETIDQKIETNTSICSDLESMAKLLYDYWFVQFDFPDENGKPYKSSGGKMEWNEELKREIPEGWEVRTVADIASLQQESMFPVNGVKYNHYSIPAFDESKMPILEDGNGIASNKYVVSAGSVLVSKLNPQFKRIWLMLEPKKNAICSTEFLPIKAELTGAFYLYELFNSDAYSVHLKQKASSSTGSRKRIDPENCMSFRFAFNEDVAWSFNKKVSSLIYQANLLPDENQQLASLRDFLLPMLMNGQVKVEKSGV